MVGWLLLQNIKMTYNKMTSNMALNLAAPHTWAASTMPSLFGVVYCYFRGWPLPVLSAALMIFACVLMQSSVNSLNDYTDYVKGTDQKTDNLERSDAVLLYENINPKSALALGVGFLMCAALIGVYLIIQCKSLIPLYIGLIGAFCIIFYSGGRTPISYLPIGELVSGVVMGALIPLGCAAVATAEWHPEIMIFALPFVIAIALIMMSNNCCDIEKDIEADRKTMPAILGREKARQLFKALIIIWIVLLWILPLILMGATGLICPILAHILSRSAMLWLMQSPVNPTVRVIQMKTIVTANYKANICYIFTLAIGAVINCLK